jgi:hypothetical protein
MSRVEWLGIVEGMNTKSKRVLGGFFAVICWALWKTRNKFTIEAKFPRQPADCIFLTRLSMQLWRPLQKRKDELLLDDLEALLKIIFVQTCTPAPTRQDSAWCFF